MTVLENDLEKAREKLTALKAVLPEYHSAAADAAAKAHKLKAEGAAVSRQAQARSEANAAQELLAEHSAEIAAVQGRIMELEADHAREVLLGEMVDAAEVAKEHRLKMDAAFSNAEAALRDAAKVLFENWRAGREARQAFAAKGNLLVPGFTSLSEPAWAGMPHEQVEPFRAAVNEIMDDLRERGAALDYATDGALGKFTLFDKYDKHELRRDELALHIWQALLIIQGAEAEPLKRYVPEKKVPVRIGY